MLGHITMLRTTGDCSVSIASSVYVVSGQPASVSTSFCVAVQGMSGDYDSASAAVSEARQAFHDAAEGERAAFIAAGADAKLAKRISVENTEQGGVILRVRSCLHQQTLPYI